MKVLKRFCDWGFIFHIFCWCRFISSVLISIMFQSSLCFEGKPKNSRMIWNHVFYRLSFYIINSTCRNWVNLTFPDFGPSEIKHSSGDIRFKQACQDDGAHHSEASAASQEIWLANAGCQRRNWIHTLGTNRWRWLRDRRNFLMLEDGTSFLENDSVNNQFQVASKTLWVRKKRKDDTPSFRSGFTIRDYSCLATHMNEQHVLFGSCPNTVLDSGWLYIFPIFSH